MHSTIQEWRDPLALAAAIAADAALGKDMCFLYSGLRTSYSGRTSLLAFQPLEQVSGAHFSALAPKLSQNQPAFDNAWFGYLGYGLKRDVEQLEEDAPWQFTLPDLWFTRYAHIGVFDHDAQHVTWWSEDPASIERLSPAASSPPGHLEIAQLASNMTREEYLHKVKMTIDEIHRGNFYQANITRKFMGSFTAQVNDFELFSSLATISPAPYSAFLRRGGVSILSSSPERFLTMDAKGNVSARPIKGSAARGDDKEADRTIRDNLQVSEKDRAENLMIVDLMRNDLSQACVPGSVSANPLFAIDSYATVHHLSSAISGKRSPQVSPLSLVQACFPPGSMTGAPKLHAMRWCSLQETLARGVYSGGLGWFGGDGSVDLSVIIRTLLTDRKHFEFQVGGGIVADSTPELEWHETLLKARAIAKCIEISDDYIMSL